MRWPHWLRINRETASLARLKSCEGIIVLAQIDRRPLWHLSNEPDGLIGLIQIGRLPLWPLLRRRNGLICLAQNGMTASVASFEKARRPHWPRANKNEGLCTLFQESATASLASYKTERRPLYPLLKQSGGLNGLALIEEMASVASVETSRIPQRPRMRTVSFLINGFKIELYIVWKGNSGAWNYISQFLQVKIELFSIHRWRLAKDIFMSTNWIERKESCFTGKHILKVCLNTCSRIGLYICSYSLKMEWFTN